MTKIVTVITTIYDTNTKEVEVFKETFERFDDGETTPKPKYVINVKYLETQCSKCLTEISVREDEYVALGNYCYSCAMAKLGA